MALISRVKTWAANETVTASDLNAEFNNILNNLTAANIDDYSTNVAEMQITTDPGEVGSESLATSVAEELERLRFAIQEMKGSDAAQWYSSTSTSLTELNNIIGADAVSNRIVSGTSSSLSSQPLFMVPNGSAAQCRIEATATDFVYVVDGTSYTMTADVTQASLVAAPSSNNTALVNDYLLADDEKTKTFGENGTTIPVDNVGSEITSVAGDLAAYKMAGVGTEYFIGRYNSTDSTIEECFRGYFFDSSSNPINRTAFSDGDTITLMKLTWIYAKTDLTIAPVYTNPFIQSGTPSSPASGDYWFDITANTWKTFNGSVWAAADAILVGVVAQDTSNCVAARSLDFFKSFTTENSIDLKVNSNTIILGNEIGTKANVYGTTPNFRMDVPSWDIVNDLESGVSEAADTVFYLYLDEDGNEIVSDLPPYDRRPDLKGYYHPHETWRAIGYAYNDGSSNLITVVSYVKSQPKLEKVKSVVASLTLEGHEEVILGNAISGSITVTLPPASQMAGKTVKLKRTDLNYAAHATFADGDVTTGTDTINIASHELTDLHKVQASNTGGTLPAGLAASTDYWVIYVDSNNIKLASSLANAKLDTAVDITAAAGTGTHSIDPQTTTFVADGYGSETIDGATTKTLYLQNDWMEIVCDGSNWQILAEGPWGRSAWVSEQQTSGSAPGSLTAGAITARALTDSTENKLSVFLDTTNDQFTLPPGTYEVEAVASCRRNRNARLHLSNITDTSYPIVGVYVFCFDINGNVTAAIEECSPTVSFKGIITITDRKVFEIGMRVGATDTPGLALSWNSLKENYVHCTIKRLNVSE